MVMSRAERERRRKKRQSAKVVVKGARCLRLRAFDSDHLGLCVGFPLNEKGDVFLLYEGGIFCAWVKNLQGVPSRRLEKGYDTFLSMVNERFAAAAELDGIRRVIHKDSGSKKVQPDRFLKKLFE